MNRIQLLGNRLRVPIGAVCAAGEEARRLFGGGSIASRNRPVRDAGQELGAGLTPL